MTKIFNIGITVIITVTTVILGAFVFGSSYFRLWEALRDFGLSVAYYFNLIFKGESDITPTVNAFSNIFKASGYLPTTAEEYKHQIAKFIMTFISKDNFNLWLANLRVGAEKISKGIVLLMPCLIALWFIVKRIYSKTNTKHGENTKPLKTVMFINDKVILPVYRLIQGLVEFIKPKNYVWIMWFAMWLFNLNIVSIVIAFLSFYFYFAISFDIPAVFIQIAKLIIDLQVVFKTIPPWVFVLAGLFIWGKIRKSRALNKLKHCEARNCGFINELPIVSMSCGSMGKRKTTLITDMALSQEVMFRQEALKRLQTADMKFPYFPWILFEDEIKICMRYRVIYNLATIKIWIEKKRKRYEKHRNSALQLYGYNNIYSDDGELKRVNISGEISGSFSEITDDTGKVISKTVECFGEQKIYGYKYDNYFGNDYPDNRLSEILLPDDTAVRYDYDEYSRLTKREIMLCQSGSRRVTEGYAYLLGGEDLNCGCKDRETNYVSSIFCQSVGYSTTTSYTYDNRGNISSVTDEGETTRYAYDELNRLTSENNLQTGILKTYEYDKNGNITDIHKKCRGEILEYYSFLYENGRMTKLSKYTPSANQTAYNISYDDVGNPCVYKDNVLKWERGRLLAKYGNNSYSYDADGVRIKKKTANGI